MDDIKTVKWLLGKTKRHLPMMLLLVFSSAAKALLSVLFALSYRNVINTALNGQWPDFFRAGLLQLLLVLALLGFILLCRYLSPKLIDVLDKTWKKEILQKLLQGEYACVSKYHSGELVNRMNNDVRTVNDGLVNAIPNLVTLVVRLVAAMVTLLAIAPEFTLILVAVGIAAVIVTSLVRRSLKSLHRRVSEKEGVVLGFLQEVIEKLMAVQAMDLSEQVKKRADILLEDRYRLQRKRRRMTLLAGGGVTCMMQFCSFITLIWCSYGLFRGTMDFGTMTAMSQLVSQLQTPFANLSGFLPKMAGTLASAERLRELEDIPGQDPAGIADVSKTYEEMEGFAAQNLSFAYDKDLILEDVSFHLPKGTFSAITGPSGIGKSTLLKLMLGIYPATDGGVYYAGSEGLQKLGRGTRGLFAYVPQGNFLFSGTIRENLLMIAPDAGEEELKEAVYVSAMDQFLDTLPDGLDTVIGERGDGLSEGQAQRVSIARAVLSGAPVLLLDEATSALDGQTEVAVLQRICGMKNRTCIAVTHRPAALEQADYQLCVHDRKIEVVSLQ